MHALLQSVSTQAKVRLCAWQVLRERSEDVRALQLAITAAEAAAGLQQQLQEKAATAAHERASAAALDAAMDAARDDVRYFALMTASWHSALTQK